MWLLYLLSFISIITISIMNVGIYNTDKFNDNLDAYQGVKNLAEADSQAEIGALENKRYYEEGLQNILNGGEVISNKDINFMTKDEIKEFVKGNVESDYESFEEDQGEAGRNKGTYLGGQKGIDFNIDRTTKKLSLDSQSNVLNSYVNNSYDIPINSNIAYLSDDASQLFDKIRIRWGDVGQAEDIQVTLYRYKVGSKVNIGRDSLLREFQENETTQKIIMMKKIFTSDGSPDSSTIDDSSYSNNPQKDFFENVIEFQDFVNNPERPLEPKQYAYFLTIETLSKDPVPVLIEAFNSSGEPVGFVGDYKTSYDSVGLGRGSNRKRIQLVQTLKFSRMKYFNKAVFSGSNFSKDNHD